MTMYSTADLQRTLRHQINRLYIHKRTEIVAAHQPVNELEESRIAKNKQICLKFTKIVYLYPRRQNNSIIDSLYRHN